MKKVLVTGATGFIGRYTLAPLLSKGYEVHATYHLQPNHAEQHVYWHKANLLASDDVTRLMHEVRPTHLLHFAWYVEHGKFWNAPENWDWLIASLNLLHRFIEKDGQRAVFAGTCAEYEWNIDSGICDEHTTPTNPNTLYGASKLALFTAGQILARHHGLSFAHGRIFFPYGPGEPPQKLVSSVIRSLLKNEIAKTGFGNQVRDFIYVDDAANAFVNLLMSDVQGPVNIGNGKGTALKAVIVEIAQQMNKFDLLHLGAIATNPKDPLILQAKTTRLNQEIQWNPSVDIKSGIRYTIQQAFL